MFSGEVGTGEGIGVVFDLCKGTLGGDVSSSCSCFGAEVDEVVAVDEGERVVFDEEEGVAERFELVKGGIEAGVVVGVKSYGGFVEDVEEAGESAAELFC